MKKYALICVLFLITFSQTPAEENLAEFEKFQFDPQFLAENNQETDFVNINQFLFSGNGVFPANIYENPYRNTTNQDNQNQQLTALGHMLEFFGAWAFWTLSIAATPSDRQERNFYYDMWEQQKEAELFYRRIFNDPDRNIY